MYGGYYQVLEVGDFATWRHVNLRVRSNTLGELSELPWDARCEVVAAAAIQSLPALRSGPDQWIRFRLIGFGWPVRSHYVVVAGPPAGTSTPHDVDLIGTGGPGGLPTWIDWPALALNTGVYSTFIALGLITWKGARRALRTARSRCLGCGYQLTDGTEARRQPARTGGAIVAGALGCVVICAISSWPLASLNTHVDPIQMHRADDRLVFARSLSGVFGEESYWIVHEGRPADAGLPDYWWDPLRVSRGDAGQTSRYGIPWRAVAVTRRRVDSKQGWLAGPVSEVRIHSPALLANLTLYAALGAVIGYALTGWRRPWRDGDPVRCPECGTLDR